MNSVTPRNNTTANSNDQPSSSNINTGGVDHCVHCHRSGTVETDLDSLPTGYRFFPTDQELIVHYLQKKIGNQILPKSRITETNVYANNPEDLVANYQQATEDVWYFFSPTVKRCRGGILPNRSAGSGYWRASTGDKHIIDNDGKTIGRRKSLVFYLGRQPNGIKTCWMMQEYVVEGPKRKRSGSDDMKLDDYVLYKIYRNRRMKEEAVNVENIQNQLLPDRQVSNQEVGSSEACNPLIELTLSIVHSTQDAPAVQEIENNQQAQAIGSPGLNLGSLNDLME